MNSVLKLIPHGILPLGILISGCNNWSKNPVPANQGVTLQDLRVNAKNTLQKPQDKPRVITETVIVEKPKIVVREEATIDDKFIVITPDSRMTFKEGEQTSFKVRARVLIKDVQVKLKAQGLPEGATFSLSAKEKDLYIISWKPALNTIPTDEAGKIYTIKLTAEVIPGASNKNASQLQGLVREKEVDLILFRTQESPSELKIENLATEIKEGELTYFSVTAKIPGIDGSSALKPRLVISYDGVSLSAGNNFLELDGSRHVVADLQRKSAEYLGDSKWKFNLLFDTKNISVQTQLSRDGSELKNADGTRVRLSFKVYSPYGLSTPESLTQIKIDHLPKVVETPQVPSVQTPATGTTEGTAAPKQDDKQGGNKNENK